MVDVRDFAAHVMIVLATLDPDRSLRRRGQQIVERTADIAMMKPVEPSRGKHRRVALSRRQLRQPSLDIAANRYDLKVRPNAE